MKSITNMFYIKSLVIVVICLLYDIKTKCYSLKSSFTFNKNSNVKSALGLKRKNIYKVNHEFVIKMQQLFLERKLDCNELSFCKKTVNRLNTIEKIENEYKAIINSLTDNQYDIYDESNISFDDFLESSKLLKYLHDNPDRYLIGYTNYLSDFIDSNSTSHDFMKITEFVLYAKYLYNFNENNDNLRIENIFKKIMHILSVVSGEIRFDKYEDNNNEFLYTLIKFDRNNAIRSLPAFNLNAIVMSPHPLILNKNKPKIINNEYLSQYNMDIRIHDNDSRCKVKKVVNENKQTVYVLKPYSLLRIIKYSECSNYLLNQQFQFIEILKIVVKCLDDDISLLEANQELKIYSFNDY